MKLWGTNSFEWLIWTSTLKWIFHHGPVLQGVLTGRKFAWYTVSYWIWLLSILQLIVTLYNNKRPTLDFFFLQHISIWYIASTSAGPKKCWSQQEQAYRQLRTRRVLTIDKNVPLRTRRALLMYKLHGVSAFWFSKKKKLLDSVNALLVLIRLLSPYTDTIHSFNNSLQQRLKVTTGTGILSDESQKGINDLQRCSIENQKGAVTCMYKLHDVNAFWFPTEHWQTVLTPFWLSIDDTMKNDHTYHWPGRCLCRTEVQTPSVRWRWWRRRHRGTVRWGSCGARRTAEAPGWLGCHRKRWAYEPDHHNQTDDNF